ncbi:hypothetical protein [Niabella drilacis]|uniref:Beta-lactamase-inhibitor-like, PepSY-like n=1 Tax=Niabella drilacis (strain DSM 25811 / CCM 8410 / CCUG 62505 / LMG 26954 / E90) TaxID=1285928 RepID=A0A1G6NFJ8_NIADE|nr:hypothetical protein [Niabella drilacis]SDC66204.1 hypothetical protein SAMN04487894_103247 [Niabella drilacis]
MKLLIIIVATAFSIHVFANKPAPVSEKVLSTFSVIFKDTGPVSWIESPDYITAVFKKDHILYRAMLDKTNGSLLQTIRYYGEANLPPNLLFGIKKKLGKKEIFGVTEVMTSQTTNYIIVVNDAKNTYKVNVDANGNITFLNKFKRGDI